MSDRLALYGIQLGLALLLAPLLPGIINRVKARFAGRRGKPVLQLYYDLAKLLRKGETISRTATWVFSLGPAVSLAAVVCALALLPLGGIASPLGFQGDFLLAACLLGVGRFALVLAALDTGSPFEGMGASREACFSALAEPALFLCFLALISLEGATQAQPGLSLSALFGGRPATQWLAGQGELLLIPAALFVLLLVENCRIPVDDPNTHLELTMIHEAMILDHSGPSLAFILYGSAVKLWFFAALIAALLAPALPVWQQIVATLAAVAFMAVLVGVVESIMARLRMQLIPFLLGGAGVAAALALILAQVR